MASNGHDATNKAASKLVDGTEKAQHSAEKVVHHHDEPETEQEKKPAGGYDATPVPKAPPGYTLKITFHSAENLPFADLSLTSDPYITATFKTALNKRHKQDPDLMLRTPTVHKNTNPQWNCEWIIAHVPASGFDMKCRLYDEDPTDHDDRLGNVHVNVDRISDDWQGFKEKKFDVKKRMGSKRAYTLRGCLSLVSSDIRMGGSVTISVENLGRSPGDSGGKAYTVGPLRWTQHFSPLIGRITGVKSQQEGKNGSKAERYNFQAIQMQLQGPVPDALYHRYVEFRPFIAGMFTSRSLRGKVLNHALHHQHARIYNYDTTTKYGAWDEPSLEMSKKFLELVHYDQGGRIFTYVLTLDGQFRFTETGKEFGIDMLSKHTMHSDVNIYIAFSGEFFVRRLKTPYKDKHETRTPQLNPSGSAEDSKSALEAQPDAKAPVPEILKSPAETKGSPAASSSHLVEPKDRASRSPFSFFSNRSNRSASAVGREPAEHQPATKEDQSPESDPHMYELIIDNDSGTYRPNARYLSQLRRFFHANFPGLRVVTLDCQKDEEKMKKLKQEQGERKKKTGKQIMYMQNSSLESISSSDEEELAERAGGASESGTKQKVKKEWKKVQSAIGPGHHDKDATEHESEKPGEPSPAKSHDDRQNQAHTTDEKKEGAGATATATRSASASTSAAPAAAAGTVATATTLAGPPEQQQQQQQQRAAADRSATPGASSIPPKADSVPQGAVVADAGSSPETTPTKARLAALDIHHANTVSALIPAHDLPPVSASTDRRSFDTAFTGNEAGGFVTPKPSLGDGGLNQYFEAGAGPDHVGGDVTPRAAKHMVLPAGLGLDTPAQGGEPGTVHDAVTTA